MNSRSTSLSHDPEELMPKRAQFVWRALIACVAGVIIGGICLCVGSLPMGSDLSSQQFLTRQLMRNVDKDIEAYYEIHRTYPRSLLQVTYSQRGILLDAWGYPVDGWQHRMTYAAQGGNSLLTSYGADGKPGGTELNCDLTNHNPRPPQSHIGLFSILANPASRPIEKGALLCALLTAFLTFFSVKTTDFTNAGRKALVLKLGLLLIAACGVSMFITAADIPNNH